MLVPMLSTFSTCEQKVNIYAFSPFVQCALQKLSVETKITSNLYMHSMLMPHLHACHLCALYPYRVEKQ